MTRQSPQSHQFTMNQQFRAGQAIARSLRATLDAPLVLLYG